METRSVVMKWIGIFSILLLASPALAQTAGSGQGGQPGGDKPGAQPGQPTQPGQPGAQPAGQPEGQPAAQPATQPAAQPATQPAAQPATQPAAQPATQPGATKPEDKKQEEKAVKKEEKEEERSEAWHVHKTPGPPITPASSAGKPKPVLPPVKSSFGSLRVIGLLSARFIMPLRSTFSGDWVTYRKGGTEKQFLGVEAQRIRLILLGHLFSKNLKYVFQGDAVLKPWLLDFKFIYNVPWIPGLSIMVGRYLPHFTLMMPILITRLETAEYPIYMTEGKYAPWRQLGGEFIYKVKAGPGQFRGIFGVFSGPVNGWKDDNRDKDYLVRAEYKFSQGGSRGLLIGADAWFGFPHCKYDSSDLPGSTCNPEDFARDKPDTDIKSTFFLRYTHRFNKTFGINSMGEVAYRHFVPRAKNRDKVNGWGLWTHIAFPIGKYIEPLVRFDYLNMNVKADHDYAWRITSGLNLFFEGIHSHLKINYIYQKNGENYSGAASWIDGKYNDDPTTGFVAKRDVHMFITQINTEF